MHPGSRILCYVLAALVIPGLSFFPAAVLLLLAWLAIARMGRHPWQLIWRTRWLLLVLFLGYGFSVPGEPLFGLLGEWTPTGAGLMEGAERALHLVVLLLWLDVLVLSLSNEELLSGLYALMTPLARGGVDTGRIALRMALTLKAIERLEHGPAYVPRLATGRARGHLHHLFDPVPSDCVPDRILLRRHPVHGRDLWVPVVALLVSAALLWAGGWM